MDDLGDFLLEGRPEILHHGGLQVRILSGLEHHGDGQRHLAEGDEVRHQTAQHHGRALARLLADLVDQRGQESKAREIALGTAALEGELRRHLLPARALLAHPHVLGHEHVLEDDHVEVVRAREVDDGIHADAR